MGKIALMLAMFLCLPWVTPSSASELVPVKQNIKQQLLGTPVYIQIFKEERLLELYGKMGNEYRLLGAYRICNFSGGLGPKRREGDFKSPEGFYSVDIRHLKPDSRFYRAINIGYPNAYDRAQGYSGNYLMIHGDCRSIGCYAMTNAYMDEIFTYVQAALHYGQVKVDIAIYPFRMTDANLQRHRFSTYYNFWRGLQPGYRYFNEKHLPPTITVDNGQYVVHPAIIGTQNISEYAFTETK
ncbi:peptidoglycan meso-diaminopimelic acid protein amidase [Nissabacter sp. SGAir0207]|uniref:peptidoglycan meso-diaminopimelic acid protein amidase n=1 Tax=Nissabacter sp. SGAir0207 TaxID=2126321 RepID=UPI0010CCDE91|nr:peptidoglycan meso-diaminopimelic acid protein amidase [Nissabacter sp. SGAir0207]QCR36981.1 transpeptidase [Nissabacter sp. SGAir0207]